jgi:leucyl-tRNA synthetase
MKKNEAKPSSAKATDSKSVYNPSSIELKWQSKWREEGTYQPDFKNAKRPFYNLMMFPYPSAEGLHVGSIYAFGGADVYSRFKRMQGNDVFEPIGLDGFGIHSENHALKTGTHPMEHAHRTEENFYRQLRSTGIGYAWNNKVETYDPDYYKWTQWLFIELFKAGLAYKKKSPVNFCPSCKTVLADEQVIDGKCERCNSVVEKKALSQWFFKTTDYAERLLENIKDLNWSEKVKVAQRNWIGKSAGALVTFAVKDTDLTIEVFTTAHDTIYGVTFMVISPENPLLQEIMDQLGDKASQQKVADYIQQASGKSEIERTAEGKEKTGVFSGAYVLNPFTNEQIPLWVADYVLMGYGTGAVMGVPGHDRRDHDFATKFKLPIKPVVKPASEAKDAEVEADGFWSYQEIKTKYKEQSVLFHSGDLDGLNSQAAKAKIEQQIEERKIGKMTVNYHLRDWLISRQRYWGPPIPMIYCQACADKGLSWFSKQNDKKMKEDVTGWYPAEELPVVLPHIDNYKPMGTGKAPLANYPEFYETICPGCGGEAIRETDVSDTFLDSAWYFFRYVSVDSGDVAFDAEIVRKWLPVTMYIGGAEHSVLHLLYARFTTMVLHDLGYIDFEEPFARFYAHGLIIKDGAKMSKSKGNVINPDVYIQKFGADAVRCYLLFLGPFNQGGDFRDTGMEGMHRFIKRVWALFTVQNITGTSLSTTAKKILHQTVKGVTEDLEELRYNTALAKLMTYYNFLVKQEQISREEAETYVKLFAPFAPHMTEELWSLLGNEFSVHTSSWPGFDERAIVQETQNVAVQVNGKLRSVLQIEASKTQDKAFVEDLASKDAQVTKFLKDKTIKQVIYVSGKVLNFVVA